MPCAVAQRCIYKSIFAVRFVALGIADGMALTVVYTDRAVGGDVVRRIISARVSNSRERKAYREAFD